MNEPRGHTVAFIAEQVGGRVVGRGDVEVRGINGLDEATAEQITFIMSPRYAQRWAESRAAAALVSEGVELTGGDGTRPIIYVADAEAACIVLLELFRPSAPVPDIGVHPTAIIDERARIAPDARIGPLVFVDRDCEVGAGVVIHAGAMLYPGVRIGAGSVLHSNCVVREHCVIGCRVLIAANVTIGSEGFGFRPAPDGSGLARVPHVGFVLIEDDVEIGAGSCIDRGKFGPTRIGQGAKIDNLVQIAHNCVVGAGAVIAGHAGIGGSCEIGEGAILAGHVGMADHRKVGAGAVVGAKSGIRCDIPPGERWLGYPARPVKETLRVWAGLRKLPDLIQRLGRRPSGRGGRRAPAEPIAGPAPEGTGGPVSD
ncbi:MAG: UDP-3-O-(3-hydroxymyristoyl)glucosamine N-acyltransferase [Planctomycetes bacterium]|nr:UDP-3-O-(3-hydroxymyristoyl)glucosamine N-acyltransferase [Planctomycetota bacterium]